MILVSIAILGYVFGCIGVVIYFWVKPITPEGNCKDD